MGPRVNVSLLLILSAGVLLAAIAVGNRMGNHVLGQVSQRVAVVPSALLTPIPEVKNLQVSLGWKHTQVVSVATDPAFPDPRVTPMPPQPPVPSTRRGRHAQPVGFQRVLPVVRISSSSGPSYTSPPLPLPLATHVAGASDAEEAP